MNTASLTTTTSLSSQIVRLRDNRVTVPLSPAVMDWLYYESQILKESVPALIRKKITDLWDRREPYDLRPDRPARTAQ